MYNTTFKQTLDIHDIYSQFCLRIKKGDTAGRLIITLMEEGKPYYVTDDCYAVLTGVKENGNLLYNKCSVRNNAIEYIFTEQTSSTVGRIDCDLTIYGRDKQSLTSPHFIIEVYDSGDSEEEIESSDEFSALRELVTETNDLIEMIKSGEFDGGGGSSDGGEITDLRIALIVAGQIDKLAQVAKSGSYNDLVDKPIIPTIDGLASEQYVNNAIANLMNTNSIATSEKPGVVKSSTQENSVVVQEDGTMIVNDINLSKIVQTEEDELVLQGGDSENIK